MKLKSTFTSNRYDQPASSLWVESIVWIELIHTFFFSTLVVQPSLLFSRCLSITFTVLAIFSIIGIKVNQGVTQKLVPIYRKNRETRLINSIALSTLYFPWHKNIQLSGLEGKIDYLTSTKGKWGAAVFRIKPDLVRLRFEI